MVPNVVTRNSILTIGPFKIWSERCRQQSLALLVRLRRWVWITCPMLTKNPIWLIWKGDAGRVKMYCTLNPMYLCVPRVLVHFTYTYNTCIYRVFAQITHFGPSQPGRLHACTYIHMYVYVSAYALLSIGSLVEGTMNESILPGSGIFDSPHFYVGTNLSTGNKGDEKCIQYLVFISIHICERFSGMDRHICTYDLPWQERPLDDLVELNLSVY